MYNIKNMVVKNMGVHTLYSLYFVVRDELWLKLLRHLDIE